MNPTRLIFGVLLLSLCVFGLPEGCLVFASHQAARPLPAYDTDPPGRIAPKWSPTRNPWSHQNALGRNHAEPP